MWFVLNEKKISLYVLCNWKKQKKTTLSNIKREKVPKRKHLQIVDGPVCLTRRVIILLRDGTQTETKTEKILSNSSFNAKFLHLKARHALRRKAETDRNQTRWHIGVG